MNTNKFKAFQLFIYFNPSVYLIDDFIFFIPFASNYESTVDHDEFQVAEKIKRRRKCSFIILLNYHIT